MLFYAAHLLTEILYIERLGQAAQGSAPQSLHDDFIFRLSGKHDDRRSGRLCAQLGEKLEPRFRTQIHIKKYAVDFLRPQQLRGSGSGTGHEGPAAQRAQRQGGDPREIEVIINDEDIHG